MKSKIFIAILIFSLAACNITFDSNFQETVAKTSNDTSKSFQDDTSKGKKVTKRAGDNKVDHKLLGIWALNEEQNASFEIQKDKILYPDMPKGYHYKISNDTIRIHYNGYDEVFTFKMVGIDTLILKNDYEQVFYRFKN